MSERDEFERIGWAGTYILKGHEAVPERDTLTWARWYEEHNRHVMDTRLIDGSRISTVFLGLDHSSLIPNSPPQLFETALISGDKHYCVWLKKEIHEIEIVARYATWGEAEDGHMEWIERCVPDSLIEATVKEPQHDH